MSAHQTISVNDKIKFVARTPAGPYVGIGKVAAIQPTGSSNWLKVIQSSGVTRVILEAAADIELLPS